MCIRDSLTSLNSWLLVIVFACFAFIFSVWSAMAPTYLQTPLVGMDMACLLYTSGRGGGGRALLCPAPVRLPYSARSAGAAACSSAILRATELRTFGNRKSDAAATRQSTAVAT